jgi:HEPN domain-containing protein
LQKMLKNEQIARAFHLEAKADLVLAELAYNNGIYSRCVSMSQQTLEKILKASLAIVGFYGFRKHEILQYFIQEYTGIIENELINKIANFTKPVEAEWVRSRYPDWDDSSQSVWIPSEHYSKGDAEKALSSAKNVFEMIINIMKNTFNFEI